MPSSSQLVSVLGWFAVAAGVALVGFFVAAAVRRWTQHDEAAQNFTFQDLRDMRARGDISAQEFDAMRAALLADMGVDAHEDENPPADDSQASHD